MSSAGVAESLKSSKRILSETEADCVPLVPVIVKLKGLASEVVRLLIVRVVL